jgi:DNA polymerase I-like protein with 3'-5' exonuclease and polymerase domains
MNKYVETDAEAIELLQTDTTKNIQYLAVDIETSGLAWESDDLFLVQCGWEDNENYAFQKPHFGTVENFLADGSSEKVFANIKFDAHFLEQAGIQLNGKWHDIQVMARLLFPKEVKGKRVSLKLKDLATQLIDEHANDAEKALKKWMETEKRRRSREWTKILKSMNYTRKEYDGWKKNNEPRPAEVAQAEQDFQFEPTYADVPKEIMEPYATNDTKYTLALFKKFYPKIKSLGLTDVYERDMQTIKHVYGWEKVGWNIDLKKLGKAVEYGRQKLAQLQNDLVTMAPDLNPESPKQVTEYFGVPNAQEETLAKLNNPVAKKILEIKGYNKVMGTYLEPIYKKAKAANGRLHGEFNVAGPVTGRFSSSNPNLQNIPKEFEDERVNPRNFFIPTPGYKLVFIDYSQMEVVIMAEYSGDENLVKAILNGEDVHTKTALGIDPRAKELYVPGLPKDNQPAEFQKIRGHAKRTTFGIFYGIGAAKLGKQIGVSEQQAKAYKANFFKTYPGVYRFMQNVQRVAQARPGRWVMNKFGRIYWGVENKEYALVDYLIQGTGADMAKIAIDRCEKILKPMKSRIISMIHDELVFEIHDSELAVVPKLREQMIYWPQFKLPIDADIEYSDTCWAEKKSWKGSVYEKEVKSLEQAV